MGSTSSFFAFARVSVCMFRPFALPGLSVFAKRNVSKLAIADSATDFTGLIYLGHKLLDNKLLGHN